MEQWLNDLRTFFDPAQYKIQIGSRDFFGLWPVSVSLKRFNTHLYVVGASGQGKSKFLQHVLHQLSTKGWGCGLFDPHSDLASDLLAQLGSHPKDKPWLDYPENRRRILYLDPSRSDYIVPCNVLKNPYSSPYEIAENVVEAFRRVWPETLSEAPRFAQIMRNAVLVLIECGLSLLELEPLLTNKEFRLRMLTKIKDPLVASFFLHQFDKWGREQPIFTAAVLNKTSAFLFKPQIRYMLGAEDNALDFRAIIDSGTVLILNLGNFRDEQTQRLLGSLFLTSLEQAAFSRSDQPAHMRRPFFAMIDEFPLFCSRDSTSLARILSECRKYRLHLGLAHQTITQLPGARIQGALENAKLKVVFGTGRQTAESIVKELFLPDPKSIKHKVADSEAQERSHPVFDPLLEQFEIFTQKIQQLRRRKVLVKLPDKERVYRLRVPKVPHSSLNSMQMESIKKALSKAIGKPCAAVEQEIVTRSKLHGVPLYIQQPDSRQSVDEDVWQ
jgi:DNA helicase HerA-like ATPase